MLISSLIVNITRVLLVMILARYYTKEEFGVWATITSTAAVLATGDFGITNSLRNKLSSIIAGNNDSQYKAKEYFYTMLFFLSGIVICIIILLFCFRDRLPLGIFFKTSNHLLKDQAVVIFFWIQVLFLINIPLGVGIPLFFSYRESGKAAIFPLAQALLSFIVTIILALCHADIVAISLTYFGVNVLVSAIGTCFFIFTRRWFNVCINKKTFISIVKELMPQGMRFMLLQMSSSLLQNAGTICLGAAISVSIAAEFNVIQKLYTFFVGIYQSILNPMWGELAINYAQRHSQKVKRILLNSTKILVFGFISFMLLLCFFGNFALKIFAGANYETTPSIVLAVGSISLFYLIFANISTLQNSINKVSLMTLLSFVGVCLIYPLAKIAPQLGIINVSLLIACFWALMATAMALQTRLLINKIK